MSDVTLALFGCEPCGLDSEPGPNKLPAPPTRAYLMRGYVAGVGKDALQSRHTTIENVHDYRERCSSADWANGVEVVRT